MLSVYSSEYLQTYALDVWELFFEKHLILDIQTTFTICKSFIAKNFWWNYNKNESFKPYFGTKEQKLFFLVVSQSDLRFEFDFANPVFFANKIARPKNRARRCKFVQSCFKMPTRDCGWKWHVADTP